jgi:S1-C subfamily serine protease
MKTKLGLVAAIIAALLFLNVGYAIAGAQEKYEAALDTWLGADINGAIRQWGPPTSEYTAPNGERTFTWITVNGTTVTGEVHRQLFGGVSVNSQSRESSCRKSLVVGRSFFSIGVTYENRKEELIIFSIQSGAPAHQAGLREGDEVIEMNGNNVKERIKAGRAASKYNGVVRFFDVENDGTPITLTVLRKKVKEPLTFIIVGAQMTDRVISHTYEGSACY